MANELPLFRHEACQSHQQLQHGDIIFAKPKTFTFIVSACVIITIGMIAFLCLGSYTHRVTATGQVTPDLGLIKADSPQLGTIAEKKVVEGQEVEAGYPLYIFNSARRSSLVDTEVLIREQGQVRIRSLQDQINREKMLLKTEQDALMVKLQHLQEEQKVINLLISGAVQKVKLMKDKQNLYKELFERKLVSEQDFLTSRVSVLEQETQLDSFKRESLKLQQQHDEQRLLLNTLPAKVGGQIAEYERTIAVIEQELVAGDFRQQWIVGAPASGTVTSIVGQAGQSFDKGQPLLSIIPRGARLQVHLYVPSSKIGFVNSGDVVYLRFRAFPYQKFGTVKGTISTISQTSSSATELTGTDRVSPLFDQNEPVYRLIVELNSQEVLINGRKKALQVGMIVDAEIMLEKLSLIEWMVKPFLR